MRLFFEDPEGERLAIDTERREWATSYDGSELTESHRYINVRYKEDLRTIEQECDFNCYGYNDGIDNAKAAGVSVFSEMLQTLATASRAADVGTAYDVEGIRDRIERDEKEGYFSATQYAALLLIVDDIKANLARSETCDSNI